MDLQTYYSKVIATQALQGFEMARLAQDEDVFKEKLHEIYEMILVLPRKQHEIAFRSLVAFQIQLATFLEAA
jgi:hypothetical protein